MKKTFFLILLLFCIHPVFAQQSNKAKMQEMYDRIKEEGILHPDFVMAQCIQETGWLNCKKCCLRYNNLFGFYINGNKCKKFDNEKECLKYYQKWQEKRYPKWRKSYPKGTYYDFLKWAKYATGDKYNSELKGKVAWVRRNLIL